MNAQSNETIDLVWRATLVIAAVGVFAMLPLEALAYNDMGDGSALDKLLCNIVSFFTGTVGKGIATLALILIGVGALLGKISWGMALIVAIGIALVFGATTLVNAIGGSSGTGTGTAANDSTFGAQNCNTGTYQIEGIN